MIVKTMRPAEKAVFIRVRCMTLNWLVFADWLPRILAVLEDSFDEETVVGGGEVGPADNLANEENVRGVISFSFHLLNF